MGFRFRKTISLGKGVRLNVSKSGVSTSVGPRGASVTFGKNGTYANLGIPGTGLSYRERIDGKKRAGNDRSCSAGSAAVRNIADYTGNQNYSFHAAVTDCGEIVFLDETGTEIVDKKLISLLRKHPQYKEEKSALEAEALELSRQYAEQLRQHTDEFLSIHRLAPRIKTVDDFRRHKSELKPRQYQQEPYDAPMPSREAVSERLRQESERVVDSRLPLLRQKEIEKYISARLESEYQEELKNWENAKISFERAQSQKRASFESKASDLYIKSLRRMDAAISGNESYIEWAVARWLNKCSLPVSVDANYDYDPSGQRLMLDLDLPEIEDIPQTHAVQMASGAFKEKEKNQKQLKEEYSRCVLGLVVYISAHLFNVSPVVREIVVSGFTTRRDSSGSEVDEYIVSVRFDRIHFASCEYALDEPEDTVLKFENRLNLTSTKSFRQIQPL